MFDLMSNKIICNASLKYHTPKESLTPMRVSHYHTQR